MFNTCMYQITCLYIHVCGFHETVKDITCSTSQHASTCKSMIHAQLHVYVLFLKLHTCTVCKLITYRPGDIHDCNFNQ